MNRQRVTATVLGAFAAMSCVGGVPLPPPEVFRGFHGADDAAADDQPRRCRRTAMSTTTIATATGASRLATAGPA